jgi:hypothetical protein
MTNNTAHNLDAIKPEMNVLISYEYNAGQGSGSAGISSITGKVKSISATKIILSLSADQLQKYVKSYQAKYKREGFDVSIQGIRSIVVL